MNFCSQCGAKVQLRIPPGDHLPRFVCEACGTVHYQNPRLVVGCVPEHEGRILLCRRAIEPRRGYWTVPAGFMENGETLQEAAARECYEEALARVQIGSLLSVVHVLHAEQVHVFFRATLPLARIRGRARRAWRWRWSAPGRFPGRTSPFAAPTSRCAATSKTGPPGVSCTTSRHWTAAPRLPRTSDSPAPRLRGTMRRPAPAAVPAALGRIPLRNLHDLCRHRKLHQVQVHGLRGSVSRGLLPRGPELPHHRSGRVHRLHPVRAGVPGGGDLFRGRTAGRSGALQGAECRAGQEMAGDHARRRTRLPTPRNGKASRTSSSCSSARRASVLLRLASCRRCTSTSGGR